MSKLLKAVNDETTHMNKIDNLNALASVLDKHREVSIQEAIYRLLSLPMTKSSVKIKYISTIHPNFRDGLLKGNIKNLDDNESIFHNSPHQYYENRPLESINQEIIDYDDEELDDHYWEDLSLTEFWSKYDIMYEGKRKESKSKNLIPLQNDKGWIKKRNTGAVLRYYLIYENIEYFWRGLLILFLPFRNEMSEI